MVTDDKKEKQKFAVSRKSARLTMMTAVTLSGAVAINLRPLTADRGVKRIETHEADLFRGMASRPRCQK